MQKEGFLVALDLAGRSVLVIGGNEEALLRVRNLVRAGARVTLVSETLCDALKVALTNELAGVELLCRAPLDSDLDGRWLAVFAEQAPEKAAAFGQIAEERRVYFCAIDQPERNTFAHVGIARAGKLQLGISTSGAVPGIAGALKKQFQELLDRSEFEKIVVRLEQIRREAPREVRGSLLRKLASKIRLTGALTLAEDEESRP